MKKGLQLLLLAFSVIGAVFGIALLFFWLSGGWSEQSSLAERQAKELQRIKTLLKEWEQLTPSERSAALPDLAKVWQVGDDKQYWEATLAFAEMGPVAVPFLVEALQNSDDQVRMYAVWSLGILGSEARPAWAEVLKRLKDDSPAVRCKAAFAAGQVAAGAEEAMPALVPLFGDDHEEVRLAASRAMLRFRAAAVPHLRTAIKNPSSEVRRLAIVTLGQMGPPAAVAVPDLMAQLRAPSSGLQDETCEALVGIGTPAIAALTEALQQEQETALRKRIILALAKVGKPAVPVLAGTLQDKDASVRLQTVTALGQMGPDALGPLLTAFQDPEAEIRQEVARVLGTMNRHDPGVVPTLIAALKDPADGVRGQAVAALRSLRPDADAVLKELDPVLEDKSIEVRLDAIRYLGEFGPAAVPRLVAGLKDPEIAVRQQVIRTLEDIRAPAQVLYPALLPLLKDENPTVRQHAINILWRCDALAVPHLVEALKDSAPLVRLAAVYGLYQIKVDPKLVFPAFVQALEDDSAPVRAGAASALCRFGNQAIPPLRTALKDKEAAVRQRAALSLGLLQAAPKEVLPVLAEALKDESVEVRIAAAAALGQVGIPAVPLLLEAFKDKDAKVWFQAKESFLKMQVGDKLLLPLLTKALKDPDSSVRQGAAYAMSRFGENGVQPLVDLLKSPDESVHWAAVDTLDTIGPLARPSFPVLAQTARTHPQPKIRKGAIVAMLTIHLGFLTDARQEFRKDPTKAVPVLIETLHGKNLQIRWEAAEILGALGPAAKEAIPALTKALQDRDPRVQQSAAAALERIRQ